MAPRGGKLLLLWLLVISEVTAVPVATPTSAPPPARVPTPKPIIVGASSPSTPAPTPAPTPPPILIGASSSPLTLAPPAPMTPGEAVPGAPRALQARCIPTNLTAYGDLVMPSCPNFTKAEGFDPTCLPPNLSTYTMLAGMGSGKEPFVYNSWIFTEVCGLRMAAWRALYQQPRRKVVCKGAEAVLENWAVYLLGTCMGVFAMNAFYVSTRGARCWGCFPSTEPGAWTCSYQKMVAFILVLLFLPIAIALLSALIYQFIHQLYAYHQEINEQLMGPVCYAPFFILEPKPSETCKDIMSTDWISSLDMIKIMMLGVFSMMESLFIVGVGCYTTFLCLMSAFRIMCCCCGCTIYTAACNRPDCMCGKYFACKLCCSWSFCHPVAFCIMNGCFIPLVLLLYFVVGMAVSILAYGLICAILIAIVWFVATCLKTVIQVCSQGRCFILPIPSFQWYFTAVNTLPTTYIRNFNRDRVEEKAAMKTEIYNMGYTSGEWEIESPSHENEAMGTPCPTILMSAFPMPVLILIIPFVMIVLVAGATFAYQDYLTHQLAWADADMKWFYTKQRMYDGTKMWIWWWQVFEALAGGLTDAFSEIFHAWWWSIKNAVTFDSSFYNTVANFLCHGVNPVNLFQTQLFYKFRAAAMFWRFMLAFIFAAARSIAMINMPFERFVADLSNNAIEGNELLNSWDSGENRYGNVNHYDPYNVHYG